MRAVIQRVISANASANGEIISSIGKGLCVLIGISRNDTKKDIEYIVRKILNLKLFEDSSGKRWSKSVKDCSGEILCLSQVTLYNSFKGNKLDFHHAMLPEKGKLFYCEFLEHIRNEYKPELVKEGVFGAHLVIGIQNDGPVTITLESPFSEEKNEEMEMDSCFSQTNASKIEKYNVVRQDSASSQTCLVKQDSASSQTCLVEQDTTYSQTVGCSDSSTMCFQNDKTKSRKAAIVKQDSTSSQTCLIKQDSTSSQTCLIKQDSISSQTCDSLSNNIKQINISSQIIKECEGPKEDNSIVNQDSKFSQTTGIVLSNVSSQTQLVKDSVSSQTCSRLKEAIPIPTSVPTQTPAVDII